MVSMAHSVARLSNVPFPASAFRVRASHQTPTVVVQSSHDDQNTINRRSLSMGLVVVVLSSGEQRAMAAGRRAPPPAPTEKKDPNVSGVQAKVLASKRRKEAMKEEMAKLRLKGKTAQPPPPQEPSEEAVQ